MTVSSAGEEKKKREKKRGSGQESGDRSCAWTRELAERNSWKFVETRAGRTYVRLSTTTDAITKMAVGN